MGGRGPSSAPRQKKLPSVGNAANSKDSCDISFTTPLAHVRTSQRPKVSVGDILNVQIQVVIQKKTIVCTRQSNNETVGFILARGASRLIECIEQDNVYVAEVKKAEFGLIEVIVTRSV